MADDVFAHPLQLFSAEPVFQHRAQLAVYHRQHFLDISRTGAGVDYELPGIDIRCGGGIDRVGQAALLTHFLEQPRGHAAAQGGVQQRGRVTVVVA